ncbi:MAG: helix-turn-helix transcriptional regulator [Verrucomicrobiota bacterium]
MAKSEYPKKTASFVVRALKAERERQKISMTQMAARAGLALATISFVEREMRNPTLDTVLRISEVLGIELGEVISRASKEVSRQ